MAVVNDERSQARTITAYYQPLKCNISKQDRTRLQRCGAANQKQAIDSLIGQALITQEADKKATKHLRKKLKTAGRKQKQYKTSKI
ncbi:hypothetical protein PO124_12115 [Bacillus licheniformis]|nr:hypothetical protein [Bacillus licheniformis]